MQKATPKRRRWFQFSLRSLLAGMMWAALVIAICVGQQQAASRQRAVIERLKAGLNDVLAKNEVAGHAHSIGSIVHLVLKDCDCDRHTCTMPHEEIKEAVASPVVTLLKRALQNSGVDMMGRDAFLVSAVHREEDVDRTLGAFEASLAALRLEGAI